MYCVRFNKHDEFLDELRKNEHAIDGRIVRTTASTKSSSAMPIRHLTYLASFVVNVVGIGYTEPRYMVTLEEYCGQLWGIASSDDVPNSVLREIGETVEAVIAELGLEHRHGVIELAGKA